MKIDHIDHLVLPVKSINETCAFYQAVMGFEVVTFGQGRKVLKFGRQKLKLQQQGNEFEPKAAAPTPGTIDLCFISGTPIHTVRRELEEKGILLEDEPVERTGAAAKLLSVYLRDPDRNLIEIANYTSE